VVEKIIQLEWLGSKSTISGFFAAGFQHIKNTDQEVGRQMAHISGIPGLIFDLGHFARGFTDFPFQIPLTIINETPLERSSVQITAPLDRFYIEVGDAVEVYLRSLEQSEHLEKLEAIRLLAQQSRNQLLQMMARKRDPLYVIKKLKAPYYSFDS
jgi:hypothetical protein